MTQKIYEYSLHPCTDEFDHFEYNKNIGPWRYYCDFHTALQEKRQQFQFL